MKDALTIKDPISRESLLKMREIHEACDSLRDTLMVIEQEKVDIIVKFRTLHAQYQKHLAHELSIRGIPPEMTVEIDKTTGVISPVASKTV